MEMATRGRRSTLSSSDDREIVSEGQTNTKIAPKNKKNFSTYGRVSPKTNPKTK